MTSQFTRRVNLTISELPDGEFVTYNFECPLCDRSDKATVTATRHGQGIRTLLYCHRCGANGTEIADALEVPIRELLADPLAVLGDRLGRPQGGRGRDPEPLPSWDTLEGYQEAYAGSRERQWALWRERRIKRLTAIHKVGWDAARGAWVFRVFGRCELVNVTWRPPKDGHMLWKNGKCDHPMRLAGRYAEDGCLPLWPHVPFDWQPWLLVEGEWDALAALQAGLPAVTGLLGKQWHDAWNSDAEGRRIAVAYDVGAEDEAADTVERLLAVGAREAWVVPLGLDHEGDDVCDWFLPTRYGGYGRTADDLLELIRHARDRRH